MSDIRSWFRSAASNAAPSPDGYPELMARSGLNDSDRETQAALKRYYDAPDFRRPFEDYDLVRVSGTHFTLTDGSVEVDASLLLEVGQRIRIPGAGGEAGDVWEGFITDTPNPPDYSDPTTTFHVEWILADSEDEDGPTLPPAFVEVSFKEIGRAAWYDTGAVDGKIPLFEDLDPHVLKDESTLDVGFLDGETREQIEMAATRGRLNANGGMTVWQRGDSFTDSTPLTSAPDNVCADNFTILSDGADRVDVTRDISDSPTDVAVQCSMLFTVATVGGNQKHGVATFVEIEDGLDVADAGATAKVSLGFWAKLGTTVGIDTIRAYLVNLKNGEPTTSPVLVFGSGTTGNVTFNATDWELPVGGAVDPFLVVPLTSEWVWHKLEGVELDQASVGSGAFAVIFVTDDATILTGAQWKLAAVQVNRGDKALPFIVTPAALERQRCLRYFESTFDEELERPDHGAGVAHALIGPSTDTGANDSLAVVSWQFSAPKFKLPTIVTYNPGNAAPAAGEHWFDGTLDYVIDANTVTRKISHLSCTTADRKKVLAISAVAHANVWGNN